MGIADVAHHGACDGAIPASPYCSLHTGAGGGTNGANEASGGGYARQALSFATGSMAGGYWSRAATAVNVPCAAGTYTEAGYWSAETTGTFYASDVFAGGNVVVVGTGASISVTLTVRA